MRERIGTCDVTIALQPSSDPEKRLYSTPAAGLTLPKTARFSP